jgi:hypothetical protein
VSDLGAPLAALGLTIFVEGAVVTLVQRRDLRRVLLAAILVNACTQPIASALYQYGVAPWLAIEIAVILLETVLYRLLLSLGWARAAAISLLANAASALVGVLLYGT